MLRWCMQRAAGQRGNGEAAVIGRKCLLTETRELERRCPSLARCTTVVTYLSSSVHAYLAMYEVPTYIQYSVLTYPPR